RIPTALALANRLKAMEHALSLDTRVLKPGESLGGSAKLPPDDSANARLGKTTASRTPGITTPLTPDEQGEYRLAGESPTIMTSGGSVLSSGSTQAKPKATRVTGIGSAADPGTEATLAPAAPGAEYEASPVKATRFTTVSEIELRAAGLRQGGEETDWRQWLALGGIVAVVLPLIGVGIYFATRSPTADQLYARIQSAAEGGPEGLTAAGDDVARFLEAFPSDARAEEIRGYQEDLELDSLERRFEFRARRAKGVESLSPVERAYLEAVQLRSTDPEAALARFQALVAVFEGPADPTQNNLQQRTSEQCLQLAKKQIERLEPTVKKINQEQRLAVRRQLSRAAKLAETDRGAAEEIWQGIITLYAGKDWAKDLVEQAQTQFAGP
ncbi:MAG TPA: hypothetical protein VFV87_12390, partial [Pirellulaceae bacterium]|nr:hypothetical protein [Pirellulaceae bacterium]